MERNEQKTENTWDLSALSPSGDAWDKDMRKLSKAFSKAGDFKGKLAESSDSLYQALCYYRDVSLEAERLGNWAFLMYETDGTDSSNMKRAGIYQAEAAAFTEEFSYFTPELLSIDEARISTWMKEKRFAEFRIWLKKTMREKDHVLSEKEERILSLYSPVSGSMQKAFMDLNNSDLDFGMIDGEKLTHGTYPIFIRNNDVGIREKAYRQYYKAYDEHKHTIADLYSSSVNEDIFQAKARGFKSSLEAALFPDNIPTSVYRQLINSVHEAFPVLHEYYKVKAEVLKKEKLHHWDCYMPMVEGLSSHHTYEEAVDIISEAIKPLGEEYRSTLVRGLTSERWVDRYENKGKRSGAFSAGGYTGNPYILTNYEEDVLDSVFTLIHEGGHSMHTWYSVRNNPYMCYNYSIFEAETASTFNECLLADYLLRKSESNDEKAYIIGKRLDDIVATLFRQTMFAEFELIIHEKAERREAVTLYATGISASIALSEKVLNGGEKERKDYISFLSSGGSEYPIRALKKAGVDMKSPEPVREATAYFAKLLNEFKSIRGLG